MASIYRRTYTRTVDGATKRFKVKHWTITYTDETGTRQSARGTTDKSTTQQIAAKLEKRVQRIKHGLPVEDQEALKQPLAQLFDQYLADMTQQGRSEVHIRSCRRILANVAQQCKFKTLSQVRPDPVITLMQQTKGGARNKNIQRDYLCAFLNYCIERDWLTENPIQKIRKAKDAKKKNPRRAYTREELDALVTDPEVIKSGRGSLYKLMAFSGLRWLEIARLEKRDIVLGDKPYWMLRAEATKGRRDEQLPMFPEAASILVPIVKKLRTQTSKLFEQMPRLKTLKRDLHRAQIARIDDANRHLDFHSFRLFFCTMLAGKMPIHKVRLLMRHKDIKMTINLYTDLGLQDIAEDVWNLPNFFG